MANLSKEYIAFCLPIETSLSKKSMSFFGLKTLYNKMANMMKARIQELWENEKLFHAKKLIGEIKIRK